MSSVHIIPRAEHNISRTNISENALKVLYRLKENGYAAYLVGGGVRDLLLEREPKDFDVATNASPDEIRNIFRNCRLIGRRFRLAHIYFNKEIIEVATFRANLATDNDDRAHSESGMIIRDNVFGTMEEDAWRRDFTINALYYNIADFSVVDYTSAMSDIKAGILRLIGEPEKRYREDPVRMLRAIRFCAKLDMKMHDATEKPILHLSSLLKEISPSRIFEEMIKLFHGGYAAKTFPLLQKYHLFKYLFPQTEDCIKRNADTHVMTMLETAFNNTDERIREDKPVTPAFLFAVLLWQPLQETIQDFMDEGLSETQARDAAIEKVINIQIKTIMIPRRISSMMRDVWKMQYRLPRRHGKRAWRIASHRRFRAAYDFLLIRAKQDPELEPLAKWWTEFQFVSEQEQKTMIHSLEKSKRHLRQRRRKEGGSKQ